jgi:signal transduction histidine kinase
MASWRPTRRSDAFDVALAAAAALTAAASLWVGTDEALFGDAADWPRVAGIAVVAAIVVPLAVRRRFPFAVLLVATAAYVPFAVMGVPEGNVVPVAYFIALYTAGAYGGARRDLVRAIGVAVICGIVVWSLIVHADDYDGAVSLTLVNGLTAATNVFYLAAAWWLGELDRTRRDREATLEAQAVTLRAAQAERARQAVHDEQVRIARELHDVIAHHVSVMGVQAGAARRVLSRTPEAVPELLGHIEQSSRQAVAELHQMLGLLRRDDEGGGGTDPQPTLRGLDGLVDQMREAGLAVETDVADDATAGLPPSVDLSA